LGSGTAAIGTSFVRASAIQASRNMLTTGYPPLDSLINGLRGGQLYVFCGTSRFIDEVVHRLAVRGAVEGKVAYMNNTNYYSEKTLVKLDRLAFHAKREGVDPSTVLENIYFAAAYSEFRQERVTDAVERAVESEPSTRLILVHNISSFLKDNKNCKRAMEGINRSVSSLWHLAVERDAIMVVTTTGEPPRPFVSSMVADLANVMVFFRDVYGGANAVLLKHPEKATPESAFILNGGETLMGRITPPFRQMYQEQLERLRSDYVALLRDPNHRRAFELLLKEAWDREHAAMGNSEVPLVLDALNLTANVHNRGAIELLREGLRERDSRIAALEERLRRLEVRSASAEGEEG